MATKDWKKRLSIVLTLKQWVFKKVVRLPLEVETIKKLLINILIMWPTHAKKVVCKTQFYRHKFFICSFWSQLQLIFHLQQMRKQRHLFAAGWVVCWEKDYVVWVVQRRRGMNILNKQKQSLFCANKTKHHRGKSRWCGA